MPWKNVIPMTMLFIICKIYYRQGNIALWEDTKTGFTNASNKNDNWIDIGRIQDWGVYIKYFQLRRSGLQSKSDIHPLRITTYRFYSQCRQVSFEEGDASRTRTDVTTWTTSRKQQHSAADTGNKTWYIQRRDENEGFLFSWKQRTGIFGVEKHACWIVFLLSEIDIRIWIFSDSSRRMKIFWTVRLLGESSEC